MFSNSCQRLLHTSLGLSEQTVLTLCYMYGIYITVNDIRTWELNKLGFGVAVNCIRSFSNKCLSAYQ